mgnify:CR=1 FL=1
MLVITHVMNCIVNNELIMMIRISILEKPLAPLYKAISLTLHMYHVLPWNNNCIWYVVVVQVLYRSPQLTIISTYSM